MTSIIVPGRYGPQVVNAVADTYLSGAFRLYGEYGEHEAAFLRGLLKPGQVALDIGANLGALTVPMARAVGPTGLVLAWEPQPRAYRRLMATLELNNLTWARAERVAAGAAEGEAKVPVPDEFLNGNHGGLALGTGEALTPVPVVTVDSLLPMLGDRPVHLIKIDVEGMELDVLLGAEQTIDNYRPLLYVESDRMAQRPALVAWLTAHGYDLWLHRPPLFNPDNHFNNPHNAYPNTVSINLFAAHPTTHPTIKDKLTEAIRKGFPSLYPIFPWLELPATPEWDWELVRRHWVKDDPYAIEPEAPEYYRVKHAVAQWVRQREGLDQLTVAEIGVRAGYSAAAFLQGNLGRRFYGFDLDQGTWGGVQGYIELARAVIATYGVHPSLAIGDTQQLDALDCGPVDLFHVDGDHSTAGAFHDIELAFKAGAKWVLVDDLDFIPDVHLAVAHAVREFKVTEVYTVWDGGYRGNALLKNPKGD